MSFLVRFASATALPNACAWSMSAPSPGVFGPSASPTPTAQTRRLTARESNEHRCDAYASIPPVLSDAIHGWSPTLAALYENIQIPSALEPVRTRGSSTWAALGADTPFTSETLA